MAKKGGRNVKSRWTRDIEITIKSFLKTGEY